MSWLRRSRPAPDVKGAEFSREVVETIRALGFGFCGTYGAMYRRQPAVRTVVDFLARNVAQLNAKVYERVSNTDRVELYDHPAAALLRHPNPVTTRYRHMFATVADIAIYDRAYWRILRQQERLAVVRISPEILHAYDETTPDGKLRRVYRLNDGTVVPRAQLIIFPGYSPDNFDEGVSPLETLRRVLEEEAGSIAHRQGMWRNAARQSGWIERPLEAPEWSPMARQRFRTEIEAMMAGAANSGRIGVLEDGMTWNGASFSPVDTEYIAGRRLTYEETAVVYGIDPSLFGLGSATKSSTEQKHTEVYQDVLGPLLREIQDELDLQLLPQFQPVTSRSSYFEFNIAEKLKGSFEQQATVLTTSVGVPVMTPNEGRARLNLPRIDDDAFDVPIMPMNVIYGGQPAVTIPTEVPGSPSVASFAPIELPTAEDHETAVQRAGMVKAYAEMLRHYFDRQAHAVISAGGKVDRDRWDRELTDDLYLLAVNLGHDNDVSIDDARQMAERINRWTFDELDESGDARHVFTVARTDRIDRHAADCADALIAA